MNKFIEVIPKKGGSGFIGEPSITHISIYAITAFGTNWVKISNEEYTERFEISEETYNYLCKFRPATSNKYPEDNYHIIDLMGGFSIIYDVKNRVIKKYVFIGEENE